MCIRDRFINSFCCNNYFGNIDIINTMSDSTSIINRLSLLLKERKNSPNSNSYTSQLFTEGVEKIIAKIKEESKELIESAETDVVNKDSIIHEAADLLFHVMVLLAYKDIDPSKILEELEKREGVSGLEEKSKR